MANKDNYTAVAKQIADYLNAFGLAFKTYKVAELDAMMKTVGGEGARVSTEANSDEFEMMLLQRGFVIFPSIKSSEDGYVRVIRASSIIGNFLNSFRYPGQHGDGELARLLRTLQNRRRPDDLGTAETAAET